MVCEQTINRWLKIQRMQKLLSFTRINITFTKHWPFRRTQHSELINVEFTIHSYTLDRLWRKCWLRGALTSLWSGSDPILEEGKLWEGTGRHSPSHIPSPPLYYLYLVCTVQEPTLIIAYSIMTKIQYYCCYIILRRRSVYTQLWVYVLVLVMITNNVEF